MPTKKGSSHTVNYRKKTGRVKQHEPFLNKEASTKPELGDPVSIGVSIIERLDQMEQSGFNNFNLSFAVKFKAKLNDHKKKQND